MTLFLFLVAIGTVFIVGWLILAILADRAWDRQNGRRGPRHPDAPDDLETVGATRDIPQDYPPNRAGRTAQNDDAPDAFDPIRKL